MVAFPNPIVNRLVIFGSDGLPDITIGPDPKITFYNGTQAFLALGLFPPNPNPLIQFIDAVNNTLMSISIFSGTGSPQILMEDDAGNTQATIELETTTETFTVGWTDADNLWGARLYFRTNAAVTGPEIVNSATLVPVKPGFINSSEVWNAVTWQNGWSAFTGSDFPPTVAYRLMPDGTVLLRGIGQAGTKADNTTLFTLPAAYRPLYKQQFVANTDVARVTVRLQVFIDGTVRIFDMVPATSPALVSFDSMRFPLGVLT